MAVFTWKPTTGSNLVEEPIVNVTKFGDGYEERTSHFLNNNPKKWSVTFIHALAEHREILAFLRARNGLEAFDWTDPNGDTNKYVCRNWNSRQSSFGVYEVTASFEQVFE